MKKEVVIQLRKLSKTFYINKKSISTTQRLLNLFSRSRLKVEALKDINLDVYKGETLGIIGHNGSGKSTLLKIIIGAIDPNRGSSVSSKGRIIRLALGMGFDHSLTARDNVYLNGTIIGLSFQDIGNKFDEIIDFANLREFIDTPIKYFSSGMKSKLAFSIAVHADADIYLIDEFFGDVGDEAFKAKSQKLFEDNILKGKTILHVSHSLDTIEKHCDRVLLLNQGKATIYNNPYEALNDYRNLAVL